MREPVVYHDGVQHRANQENGDSEGFIKVDQDSARGAITGG